MNPAVTTALSLDAIFSSAGLLADRDGDGLPDAVRACLVVDAAGQPEHLAMMDLAARLGFESLAVAFPLACADPAAIPAGAVPLFVGRPTTLPAACPPDLADALRELQPGDGLVAIAYDPEPAVLIGGSDAKGLAGAARVLAADAAYPGASGIASLSAVCRGLRAALGRIGLTALVERALTRQGRLAEVRLRAADGAASSEAVREALAPLASAGRLTCDVVALSQEPSQQVVRVEGSAQHTGVPAAPPAVPEPHEQLPPLRSLAAVYGPAGFSADADGDLLPEVPRTRVVLPDDLSPSEAVAAIHLAARLGLETLGLALPLGAPAGDAPAGDDVLIMVLPLAGDDTANTISPRLIAANHIIELSSMELQEALQQEAEENPALEIGELFNIRSGQDRPPNEAPANTRPQSQASNAPLGAAEGELHLAHEADGRAILRVRGGDARGREAALTGLAQLDPRTAPAAEPSLDEVERALNRICALADAVDAPESAPALLLDETWSLSWEVDDAWQHFTSDVLPALAALPPDQRDWLLDVRVGEPDGRRQQIRREMVQALRAAGIAADDDQVRVLPAYRQGRAWLLEEVVPRLMGLDVATVTVRVQRFESDGPCLELPVYWLQDLHPVDELVEERLGLPHGAVSFELNTTSSTYEVEARDAQGGVVWRSSFDVVYGRRPYLPGFPAWGDVHPPTGCVRLLVAGAPVVDARLPPDPERAWNRVQELLLPRLREHIHAVTDGRPRPELQPFFGSLTVAAWLSEEDTALGLREEWTSPLESLHEDLYFMLLDYCSAVMSVAGEGEPFLPPWVRPPARGEGRRGARLWTAPGLIVPRIHRRDGAAGRVRVQLTAATGSHKAQTSDVSPQVPGAATVRVVGLRLAASDHGQRPTMRRLHVALDGSAAAQEQARRTLASWDELRMAGALDHPAVPASWVLDVDGDAPDAAGLPAEEGQASLPRSSAVAGPPAPAQPDGDEQATTRPDATPRVPWDRVLGLPEIEAGLGTLARSPYACIFRAGRSAGDRPSYAVELTVPRGEGIWSRAKLSAWKCTLLLNARHHGNEPSSTSALLRLAELLAFDRDWRHYLNRVNVVLIPCENPDGAALSVTLQDEHPTWMLHAGRYNAAGLEFTAEYTNPYTRHTEALVLPALWRRWAPDIACDDHGFPSHEWVQPFSGHCNPWFQSHWIAQGLIYLILPRITNPRYAQHARAVDGVRQRLVRALAGDPRVRARNSIYVDRYRTYLSNWLPEAFPAPVEDDVLVHTFDYDPDDRTQGRASLAGVPGAYPGVTAVSLITEVADETAQGRYMELCAHTHLLADRALLDYLYDVDAPAAIERGQSPLPDGRILLRAVRRRPALPP